MGSCIIGQALECWCCPEDRHIGHEIYKKIPTELSLTGKEEIDKLVIEGNKMLVQAERIRQKTEAAFEDMFIKTGACVLKQPNIERAILASMIHFLILLTKAAKDKNKNLSDFDFSLSSFFIISTSSPFFSLNEPKIKEIKQSLTFELDPQWVASKDSIIHCLGSIESFSEMFKSYQTQLVSVNQQIKGNFTSGNSLNQHLSAASTSIEQIKKSFDTVQAADFVKVVLEEVASAISALSSLVSSATKFKAYLDLAEHAVEKKILNPMDIVFSYAIQRKCKTINDYKENLCYIEKSDEHVF